MTHAFRVVLLALIAATAAALITASQGCAGNQVTPQTLVAGVSHVASKEQDLEQRLAKGYNAMCFGRESAVECVQLQLMLDEINLGKIAVYDAIADFVAMVGGEVVQAPPEPEAVK